MTSGEFRDEREYLDTLIRSYEHQLGLYEKQIAFGLRPSRSDRGVMRTCKEQVRKLTKQWTEKGYPPRNATIV